MRALALLISLSVVLVACGDDSESSGGGGAAGGGAATGGAAAGGAAAGGAGGEGQGGGGGPQGGAGGGQGGTGGVGGGSSCVALPESCDGTDEDCDGVIDDGPCSTPVVGAERFLTGGGVDHARGVAFDSAGNVYITGTVTAGADFGDGPVTGVRGYVASFAPDLTLRWKVLWGSSNTGYDYGQAVAVSDGLACVGGAFAGSFDFGGGAHTAGGFNDAFVLCLDPTDGSYLWDRTFGADLSEATEGVAITANDDVLVTGSFENSADFGAGTVMGVAYTDAFVARYGADGSYQWAHTYSGSGGEEGKELALDAQENVYVVGAYASTVDFGGGPRPNGASFAPFVLALDANGGYRWDLTQSSNGYITLYGVVTQSNGDVVIGGEFNGTLELGGASLPGSASGLTMFALGLDPNGVAQWSYAPSVTDASRGFGLAVGPDDSLVLAGVYTGAVTFGDEPRTGAGQDDLVAVGLTPDGRYVWDATFGGVESEEGNTVAIDANGRVAIAGGSWGDLDLGLGLHSNGGSLDGLLFFLD